MAHLHVSVRYQSMVVEDRVVPVHDGMRLGEHPRAAVSFPGADIAVRKAGDRLMIRGLWVAEGEEVHLHLGQVQVRMEHLATPRFARLDRLHGDLRILVATAAVALLGMWWEAATHFVATDAAAAQLVASLQMGTPPEEAELPASRRTARIHPERPPETQHIDTGEVSERPEYGFIVACRPDGPPDPERFDDPGLDRVCHTE